MFVRFLNSLFLLGLLTFAPVLVTAENEQSQGKPDPYIIKEANGIVIDGEDEDFGSVDNLHKWHPPLYMEFGGNKKFVNPQNWKGPEDLSGRAVLQMDRDYLYAYVEAMDDDSVNFDTGNRWNADYAELFISWLPHSLRNLSWQRGDVQIQLSPGDGMDKKASVYILATGADGKKKEVKPDGCEIVSRKTNLEINGKSSPGWIIEAKIPLKLFPEFKKNSNGYIEFAWAVGDLDKGETGCKCYAAGTTKAHASVKDYLVGFIFRKCKISRKPFELGCFASEKNIPKAYLPDSLKGKDVKIWDMDLATRKKLPGREGICLNGIWGVKSFKNAPESLGDSDWNYLAIPIDPMNQPWYEFPYFKMKKNKLRNASFGSSVANTLSRAYCREFKAPEDWKGKRIFLSIADRGVASSCYVFLNGSMISGPEDDGRREIEIGDKLLYGTANKLLIFARCTAKNKAGKTRALYLGDIWLFATGKEGSISSCFVKTSVRKKQIQLDFSLAFQSNAKDLKASAEICDWKTGKVEFSIPPVSLDKIKTGPDKYTLTAQWKNPKLWSPAHPDLYVARVMLMDSDGKPVDSLEQRFGFKEVWIEGRKLMVNGVPTRLRAQHGSSHKLREQYVRLKKLGYNCVVYFGNPDPQYFMNWMDELGLYLIPHIGASHVGAAFGLFDKSQERRRWLERSRNHPSVLMWIANLTATGGEAGWIQWNYSVTGSHYFPDKGAKGKLALQKNKEIEQWFKEVDPTRPIIDYCSGNQGPVWSIMNHADFGMSLQEAGGGAETWFKTKNAHPFLLLESWPNAGTGENIDMWRQPEWARLWVPKRYTGRKGAENNIMIEEASQYLGEKAYEWSEPVRTYMPQKQNNPLINAQWGWDRPEEEILTPSGYWYVCKPNMAEAAIAAMSVREHARSDRGYGLTGRNWFSEKTTLPEYSVECSLKQKSAQPWNTFEQWFKPINEMQDRNERLLRSRCARVKVSALPKGIKGADELKKMPPFKDPFEDYFKDATEDALVYIGGGPEKDKFRYKDHAYFSGEKVVKNIVLINDSESAISFDAAWTLKDKEGKVLEKGVFHESLNPGDIRKVPLEATLPAVNSISDFTLSLEAKNSENGKIYNDSFALQAYPPLKALKTDKIFLWENGDAASKLFSQMNVPFKRMGENLPESGILAVGRDSLNSLLIKVKPENIKKAVENGLKMLIMEQGKDVVYGSWLKEIRLRNQFVKIPKHPALKGLTDRDFTQWRGESSMTPSHPDWEPASEYMDYKGHQMFGKWGNEGIVCTLPLRRPQHGNCRVLLAGGFDQEWAGVVEFQLGRGAVIISQMDVSGRTQDDPAAELFVSQMLKYLIDYKAPDLGAIEYAGSLKNKKELERFSLEMTDNPASAKVLICDASSDELDKKKAWLSGPVGKNGKPLLLLWPNEKSDLSWISPEIKISKPVNRKNAFYKAIKTDAGKKNPLLDGINTEDLFFRFRREEQPFISKVPAEGRIFFKGMAAEIPYEKGRIVIWMPDPLLHEGERSFKKAVRSFSNLLTNLGARQECGLSFEEQPLDLSHKLWAFKTDPKKKGHLKGWNKNDFDDSSWQKLRVGKSWESQGVTEENKNVYNAPNTSYNGFAWYRINFEIPKKYKDKDLYLQIAAIAGEDDAWLNGKKIGSTTKNKAGGRNYRKCARNYKLPLKAIKPGKNTIAIRVNNIKGFGGLSKLPVRIMTSSAPNDTPLAPMEKDRKLGDPYRFIMW